ncbi:helix-turn-helix transcriptional regulator [Mycobacterium servetii]|uniref:Helix-turn-helix transcriptional regulator n=1 Tax=Mycobacterium servetii TaxID=3237418 RepID=A0ABV4BWK4_9MYCO
MQRARSTPKEHPEYLTMQQVADRLQVSKQTLSYWRSKNTGPLSMQVGRGVRYPVPEFEAWLAKQAQRTARGEKATA